MTDVSNRDRILDALRLSSRPLDDDQLSDMTGVRPRQQVNQICRALHGEGILRRVEGPDGKIVNEILTEDARPAAAVGGGSISETAGASTAEIAVIRREGHRVPPGDSAEQRDAERVMLDLLGRDLGLALEPATIAVASGARVEVDGCDASQTVLVECWAHQGPPKPAQRNKVLADVLKLTWIVTTIYPRPRLIVCMSDPLAAAPFLPPARSWAARALQDFAVTVHVVDLPAGIRERVRAAQQRQYR